MGLVAGIMILAALTAITLAVGLTMKSERQIMLDRVRKYGYEQVDDASVLADDLTPPFTERMLRPALQRIAKLRGSTTRRETGEQMRRRLDAAGNPFRISATEFSVVKWAMCGIAVLAGAGLTSIMGLAQSQKIMVVLIFAALGYLAPDKWLAVKTAARKNVIERDLPNTIDLLNVSMDAGLGFDAAVARIVEKTTGPLADEFQRALQEMRMGKARVAALRSMADRAQVSELSAFVAAVYQAEELGASMTKVLRVQGEMMRSRRRMRAREIAAKLPVKMLFPLVFCIFPSIFIAVLGPGMIQISKTMLGK
jgi:tight adherence protein C